jgi:hypothetical protein
MEDYFFFNFNFKALLSFGIASDVDVGSLVSAQSKASLV